MADVKRYTDAIRDAIYGEEVRGSIADAIDEMNVESSGAYEAAISAQDSASASAATALSAKDDAVGAKNESQQIKIDVESLKDTALGLTIRAEEASYKASLCAASTLTNKNISEEMALRASTFADSSYDNMRRSIAARNETEALKSSTAFYRNDAERIYELISQINDISKSWAVGPNGTEASGTDTNNSYYWYYQALQIAQGIGDAFLPMGTILFQDLPTSGMQPGHMYVITDEFTTDDRFKEGSGKTYQGGSKVYYSSDNYWNVIANSSVSGVKGNAESTYRSGNVNLTPENLGAAPLSELSKYTRLSDFNDFVENSVSGVKGAAESSYRTGNINLTPENIGALPSSEISKYAKKSSMKPIANEYIDSLWYGE